VSTEPGAAQLVCWFVLSYESVPEERCASAGEIILGSFAANFLKKVQILTLIALSTRLA
jgi:hypothetical protein